MSRTVARVVLVLALTPLATAARAEDPVSDEPRSGVANDGSPPTYAEALVLDLAVGFVPVANDVPLIAGGGVRLGGEHELFARGGYMPTGDDVGHGFAVVGYRAVLLPGELFRPVVGGYGAVIGATCTHDETGAPSCEPNALFILSATGGVRIEPLPWLGIFALLSLGIDSYPNPFGMVEVGATFALPLS